MKLIGPIGKENLFHELSDEEVARFSQRFRKVKAAAGEFIFRENETGDTLFIVQKGLISMKRSISPDVDKEIFVANEGMVFGEFSFMDIGDRSATALVLEDAELLALKRDEFDGFIAENPSIGTKIYSNLLYILVERLRRTNDAYRDVVRWNLELTGTRQLNFQYLITENVDICLDLISNRIIEGRVIQLEKSDAGYEIIMLDRDGKVTMIPYHAIATISLAE